VKKNDESSGPDGQVMSHLWKMGYAAEDIVGNIFRVCKTHSMAEYLKLEFIKVLNNRFHI
jgi:hypothetical protein